MVVTPEALFRLRPRFLGPVGGGSSGATDGLLEQLGVTVGGTEDEVVVGVADEEEHNGLAGRGLSVAPSLGEHIVSELTQSLLTVLSLALAVKAAGLQQSPFVTTGGSAGGSDEGVYEEL